MDFKQKNLKFTKSNFECYYINCNLKYNYSLNYVII